MVEKALRDLLDDFKVDKEFRNEVKNEYRLPLQNVINSAFDVKPSYRYGGSLAKGTCNSNSCDIDLLCYLNSDCALSLQDIYSKVDSVLRENSFIYTCKNSAICVTGDSSEGLWELPVDIVPGKYTDNTSNSDVFLWCNRDKARLKSNPETHIEKIKQSKMKDVVRLIKLYRSFGNFKFKSFFLEIFAVDVVEPELSEGDALYDMMVKFCSYYGKIGTKRIH